MESKKIVLRETSVILIGEIICTAVMFAVYGLLGAFDRSVVLGGLAGILLSTANFFFMAIGASLAADKAQQQNVKGGKGLIRSSYLLRLVVLFVLLFACAKSGLFDLIALVLPLFYVRPIITIAEFFRKSGDKNV